MWFSVAALIPVHSGLVVYDAALESASASWLETNTQSAFASWISSSLKSCEVLSNCWLSGRASPASQAMYPANDGMPNTRARSAVKRTKETVGVPPPATESPSAAASDVKVSTKVSACSVRPNASARSRKSCFQFTPVPSVSTVGAMVDSVE